MSSQFSSVWGFGQVWDRLRCAHTRKCRQYKGMLESEARESEDAMGQARASLDSLGSRLHVAFDAIHRSAAEIERLTHRDLYRQLVEMLKR